MKIHDNSLQNLLDLNGINYVIDETLGLWVKFEVTQIIPTIERPHGIKYSLNLHDRFNKRILGFDNAHSIVYGKKQNVAPKRTYYHWHRDGNDAGKPYNYVNPEKLIEDFWFQVEKFLQKLRE